MNRQFSRKGAVALKTLRRPTIQDFHGIHNAKAQGIDKKQTDLCALGGLDGLLHLLQYEQPRVQALVPGIVNSLITNAVGDVVLLEEKAWAGLAELCTVKEIDIRRDATWSAAILAAQPECHECIGNAFGWDALLLLANSEDGDMQIAASILIANLATNQETQAQLISSGGFAVLLNQAKKTNDIRLKRAIGTAISNAVIESDNAREFDKQDGIKLLSSFLAEKDEELTPIVLSTIANIASSDEDDIKNKVVSDIGLEVVIENLSSKNAQSQQSAAVALGHYSAQEDLQQKIYDAGAVPKLLGLVKSSDKATLGGVAMAISNLSQNSSLGKKMYDDGVLEQIKPLVSNNDIKEAETAMANLNLYAPPPPEPEPEPIVEEKKEEPAPAPVEEKKEEEPAPAPVEEKKEEPAPAPVVEEKKEEPAPVEEKREEPVAAVSAVVAVEQPEPEQFVEIADLTQSDTAVTAPKKEPSSVSVSAIAGFVGQLLSDNVAVQREGSSELAKLASEDSNKEAVVGGLGNRGLTEVQNLFKVTKDPQLLVDLAKILHAVASTPIRDKLRFAEIAPIICTMLQGPPEQQTVALQLVSPLLHLNVNNQAVFSKLNGMDLIINILKTASTDEIKGLAAKALHTLISSNRQLQANLSKKKALHYISQLLESHNVVVQRSAASCIYGAAFDNLANQNELKKAGVLAPLTRLLSSPNEGVQQIAAGAFFALFHENKKLAEAATGAIPNFITLLRSKNAGILRNTMAAVSELVYSVEKAQEQFCTPDVAASLVNLLSSSDFWISFNTLTTVEQLLKKKANSKRREVFRDMKLDNALTPIINSKGNETNEKRAREAATKTRSYLQELKK